MFVQHFCSCQQPLSVCAVTFNREQGRHKSRRVRWRSPLDEAVAAPAVAAPAVAAFTAATSASSIAAPPAAAAAPTAPSPASSASTPAGLAPAASPATAVSGGSYSREVKSTEVGVFRVRSTRRVVGRFYSLLLYDYLGAILELIFICRITRILLLSVKNTKESSAKVRFEIGRHLEELQFNRADLMRQRE